MDDLVKTAHANVRQANLSHLLESGQLEFVEGDGRMGHALHAPYSAIHVGAAAQTLPQSVCISALYYSALFCSAAVKD